MGECDFGSSILPTLKEDLSVLAHQSLRAHQSLEN